jgi:restriction system protein
MDAVWMVKAGEGGSRIDDFRRGYVGIGWSDIGNLGSIQSQDEIRNRYMKARSDEKPGKIPNAVAMIYKFRSVISRGDKIITYSPDEREYLVGTVTSDYIYNPDPKRDFGHVREVSWEGTISRDVLSVSSRNSLGSQLALFSVNEEVWAEISAILAGHKEGHVEEEGGELEQIRQDTISKANELIKDKILSLSPEELEQLAAAILRAMGYHARITPPGPDRGMDVFASPDGLGLEEPRIKVEVKHRSRSRMGTQEIRSFLGGLREGDRGLYISTGGFTNDAKYEADRSVIPITLLGLDDLAALVVTHYENFDPDDRVLIPLVKVYWPAE